MSTPRDLPSFTLSEVVEAWFDASEHWERTGHEGYRKWRDLRCDPATDRDLLSTDLAVVRQMAYEGLEPEVPV